MDPRLSRTSPGASAIYPDEPPYAPMNKVDQFEMAVRVANLAIWITDLLFSSS